MAQLVIKDLPSRLVRAFAERDHAAAMVAGRIRLRSIRYYREIEDEGRRDSDESVGRLRVPADVQRVAIDLDGGLPRDLGATPGHLNLATEFLDPTYLVCCSDASAGVSSGIVKFGDFLVDIFNPKGFSEAVLEAAGRSSLGGRGLHFVDAFPVEYTKGDVGAAPLAGASMRLSYGQKPPSFADEKEFRLAVVVTGGLRDAPEFIDLTLENPREYLRHFESPPA
ncbi:MAG: hypothetical protein ABIZ70_06920 [Gemmatimonadales bacterium]